MTSQKIKMNEEKKRKILERLDNGNDPFASNNIKIDGVSLCDIMNKKQILKEIERYKWFHSVDLGNKIKTKGTSKEGREFCLNQFDIIDFKDKKVLDIGCRDGFYSFQAEKRGAEEIIGIDTNLSKGATEFLIPFFDSKVKMYEEDFYTYQKSHNKVFDIVFFSRLFVSLQISILGFKKTRRTNQRRRACDNRDSIISR